MNSIETRVTCDICGKEISSVKGSYPTLSERITFSKKNGEEEITVHFKRTKNGIPLSPDICRACALTTLVEVLREEGCLGLLEPTSPYGEYLAPGDTRPRPFKSIEERDDEIEAKVMSSIEQLDTIGKE